MRSKRERVRELFMSESNPDGFRSDEPEWTTYCDIDGCRLGAETHFLCVYFKDYVHDDDGTVIGIRCARPRETTD